VKTQKEKKIFEQKKKDFSEHYEKQFEINNKQEIEGKEIWIDQQ
jgi:hypothetical protein